jgi:uncharacterized membrane protein YcgQ (UPF0703/DUF1980 family)
LTECRPFLSDTFVHALLSFQRYKLGFEWYGIGWHSEYCYWQFFLAFADLHKLFQHRRRRGKYLHISWVIILDKIQSLIEHNQTIVRIMKIILHLFMHNCAATIVICLKLSSSISFNFSSSSMDHSCDADGYQVYVGNIQRIKAMRDFTYNQLSDVSLRVRLSSTDSRKVWVEAVHQINRRRKRRSETPLQVSYSNTQTRRQHRTAEREELLYL